MSMSPKLLPSHKSIPDDRPYRDSTKGNLIIRSADGVEFYVERAVIAHLSPVFQDMFSIPSPSDAEAKPVVDVTELGVVWDALLGFCHFLSSEPFPSLSTIRALLEAARKYRISAVEEWMRNTLLQSGYAETQALRTYAIACAYGLEDVALVAARGCIGLTDDHGGTKELELITALQYTRLGDFHKRCGSAAALAVSIKINSLPGWLTRHGAWLGLCATCLRGLQCANNVITVRSKMKTKVLLRIRRWWRGARAGGGCAARGDSDSDLAWQCI